MMGRRRFLALAGNAALASGVVLPHSVHAAPRLPAPPRRLTLYNAHTGERFDGPYRGDDGPLSSAMDDLSHLLRDHHSGIATTIDVGVLDFLASVLAAVGAKQATILSAYRTPETNAKLARTTFGVAENSQHVLGRALDIHIDSRLADAASAARAMKRGGVGWYPSSGFFHLDTGPVRDWSLGDGGLGKLLLEAEQQQRPDKAGSAPAETPPLRGSPFEAPGQLVVDGDQPMLLQARKRLTIAGRAGPQQIGVPGSGPLAGKVKLLQGEWTSLTRFHPQPLLGKNG